MEESLCEAMLSVESPTLNIDDLYWTYIANCVFNAYFSYTAIMMNILTIHAMRNSSSLPKTLKTLLLSLAVSDLGVGLLAQPFYSALVEVTLWSKKNKVDCFTIVASFITAAVFAIPSFLGVMALSVDRFLAVHLHLRYQELVTHKRVVAVVISMWLTSPLILLIYFTTWIPKDISLAVIVCLGILCLVITALLNFKIYLAARRHKIQIQALQLQEQTTQDGTMTTFASIRKSALGTFYVYLVFIMCYFPRACNWAFVLLYGTTTTAKAFSLYSWTLMFLNSSLNPVIYCWKIRQIRLSIMNIVRSIFPTRN
ncbi:adenosine receptor A2a-like [Oculina patagonica]